MVINIRQNILSKILCSIPVILLTLYFLPVVGILLILFRYYIYRGNYKKSTPFYLVAFGLLILAPKLLNIVLKKLEIENVKFLGISDFVNLNIYDKLMNYGKLLITVGVILWIFSVIFKTVGNKLSNKLANYIHNEEMKDYEIRKENDLKMQEKREKAKHTRVIKCPHCGSDNMISEKVTNCKYCRQPIENIE